MGPDDVQVAQLVFDHFRDRGFRQYAFVGLLRGPTRRDTARAEHFQRLVGAAGFEHFQFDVPIIEKGDLWEQQCRHIIRWLKQLPRPVAIMTCNDDAGLLVLDACRRAEIPVPGEIAVAGVGDDECLCDLAVPPLTSVDLDPRRIGYEAAAWLDRMMDGQAGPQEEIQIAPRRIVARMSSDVMATDDERVAKALRLIRERACEGLRVAESSGTRACRGRPWNRGSSRCWAGRSTRRFNACDWSGFENCWPRPTCRSSGLPKPPATGTRST